MITDLTHPKTHAKNEKNDNLIQRLLKNHLIAQSLLFLQTGTSLSPDVAPQAGGNFCRFEQLMCSVCCRSESGPLLKNMVSGMVSVFFSSLFLGFSLWFLVVLSFSVVGSRYGSTVFWSCWCFFAPHRVWGTSNRCHWS